MSLLNWTDGSGNARFWALKLLLDEFPVGEIMVASSVSTHEPGAETICSEANYPDAAVLRCLGAGAVISEITFSSYGTPEGSCGNYVENATCNAPNSSAIVQNYCFGRQSCTVPAITPIFGDPCVGTYKKLVIQARCSSGNGTNTASPLFAQGFVSSLSKTRKILLVNKVSRDLTVTFPNEHVAGVARCLSACCLLPPSHFAPPHTDSQAAVSVTLTSPLHFNLRTVTFFPLSSSISGPFLSLF